jgi:CRISPR/Cas system-associated exonuclease Cas4 (RecB family)
MTKLVDHWSYSSVESYLRCPWGWYKGYVERIRQPEAEQFKIGEALHYVLECNAKKFALEGKRFERHESHKLFKEIWSKSHEMLVDSYYQANKWLEPMADKYVEYDFKLDCYGVPLHGVIDIITKDNRVIDYKTSAKPYSTDRVQDSLQLSLYSGVFLEEFKRLPEKVGYQVIMKDFSGVQSLWDDRTLVQVEKAKKLVKQCDDEVNNKKIFEKKKGKLCPWCSYKEVCGK